MSIPSIVARRLGGDRRRPVLVLGPSLGTSAAALWGDCAKLLADRFDVVAWDLPGHGLSPVPTEAFSIVEVAEGVLAAVDHLLGETGRSFYYAGDSVGAAVGLHLL